MVLGVGQETYLGLGFGARITLGLCSADAIRLGWGLSKRVCMGSDFGVEVWGLGLGFGFRVWVSGLCFRFGFRVWDSGSGFGFGFRVWVLGLGSGCGFRVSGFGFGFRV